MYSVRKKYIVVWERFLTKVVVIIWVLLMLTCDHFLMHVLTFDMNHWTFSYTSYYLVTFGFLIFFHWFITLLHFPVTFFTQRIAYTYLILVKEMKIMLLTMTSISMILSITKAVRPLPCTRRCFNSIVLIVEVLIIMQGTSESCKAGDVLTC